MIKFILSFNLDRETETYLPEIIAQKNIISEESFLSQSIDLPNLFNKKVQRQKATPL